MSKQTRSENEKIGLWIIFEYPLATILSAFHILLSLIGFIYMNAIANQLGVSLKNYLEPMDLFISALMIPSLSFGDVLIVSIVVSVSIAFNVYVRYKEGESNSSLVHSLNEKQVQFYIAATCWISGVAIYYLISYSINIFKAPLEINSLINLDEPNSLIGQNYIQYMWRLFGAMFIIMAINNRVVDVVA